MSKIDQVANALGLSERQLFYIINNIDDYYYDIHQPKMKYGEYQKHNNKIILRHLCPSMYPLKGIQKRINNLLQQITLPDYVFGAIRGSNNILNAREHINNNYFFSVDLKNFFTNISHHQVYYMFRNNQFSHDAARI